MSEQDRPHTSDEGPVIGGATPPPPPPTAPPPSPPEEPEDGGIIGSASPPRRPVDPWETRPRRARPATPGRQRREESPLASYYDSTNVSARRTAAVYFFTIMALVIGGVLIFLLFQVISGDDDPEPTLPVAPAVESVARIDEPVPGARLIAGEEYTVIASAVSEERITLFELIDASAGSGDGIIIAQQFESRVTESNTYAAELRATFEAAGTYVLVVRAVPAEGDPIESAPIQVSVAPAATEAPPNEVRGQIVAVTSLRVGPRDGCSQAGTAEPDQVVVVIARTADDQWLQIETGDGLWVRRSAVEITSGILTQTPLGDTPCPDPTPQTPPTDPEDEETPSPTASPTPEVAPNAPDFIPANAVLLEGGAVLRVTLTNVSTNPFSGTVVVRVEDVPAVPAEQALNVSMEPNGDASLDFTIDPPLVAQTTVKVIIDPDNAITESSEDNNESNFIVLLPPEGPSLSLVTGITGGILSVTIANDGGELSTNDARLEVSVPDETIVRVISPLVIARNGSTTIGGISVPRTGATITITLFIDNENVATVDVPNPNTGGTNPWNTPRPEEPTEPEEPGEPEEPNEE